MQVLAYFCGLCFQWKFNFQWLCVSSLCDVYPGTSTGSCWCDLRGQKEIRFARLPGVSGWGRGVSFPPRRGFLDRQLWAESPLLVSLATLYLFLKNGESQACWDREASRLSIIVKGFPFAGATCVSGWKNVGSQVWLGRRPLPWLYVISGAPDRSPLWVRTGLSWS